MLIVVNNRVRVEEKGDEKRDGDGCVEPVVQRRQKGGKEKNKISN